MARTASPYVGVGGGHDDAAGIGPVVVQAFPDAGRALGDISLGGALGMHLEVPVGAVTPDLGAVRPEVGQPGQELPGRRGGRLVQLDRGHGGSWIGSLLASTVS